MRWRWRLRTRFGEDLVVVRDWDARSEDAARRVPALFIRFELRDWLLGWDGFERGRLLEIYREIREVPLEFRSGSPGDLHRYVLPALEEAFERGTLVAFKLPRPEIPVSFGPAPEDESEGADVGRTQHWAEFRFLDVGGRPIADVPYKLDLPDGKRVKGTLDAQGSARAENIPEGVSTIILADVEQVHWTVAEIGAHEPVGLAVTTSGFDAGEAVLFEVFRLFRERSEDVVATLDGTLDQIGHATATWTPDSIEEPDGQFVCKATVGDAWRTSDPLVVRRDAVEAEWPGDLATEGNELTVRVRLRGVRDGESATIRILEKCWWKSEDEEAEELEATVDGGTVTASWTVPAASAPPVFGNTGRRDFYFVIETGDLQCTSDLIAVFPKVSDQ
jgi:hypothetical protein